ncbi:MAG: hypothetical protein LBL86_03200 [Coriobacteriales bacterium]|jgi:hypothetical protein|nr:hypothetical protein [Coriobacteriales bacterium]
MRSSNVTEREQRIFARAALIAQEKGVGGMTGDYVGCSKYEYDDSRIKILYRSQYDKDENSYNMAYDCLIEKGQYIRIWFNGSKVFEHTLKFQEKSRYGPRMPYSGELPLSASMNEENSLDITGVWESDVEKLSKTIKEHTDIFASERSNIRNVRAFLSASYSLFSDLGKLNEEKERLEAKWNNGILLWVPYFYQERAMGPTRDALGECIYRINELSKKYLGGGFKYPGGYIVSGKKRKTWYQTFFRWFFITIWMDLREACMDVRDDGLMFFLLRVLWILFQRYIILVIIIGLIVMPIMLASGQ